MTRRWIGVGLPAAALALFVFSAVPAEAQRGQSRGGGQSSGKASGQSSGKASGQSASKASGQSASKASGQSASKPSGQSSRGSSGGKAVSRGGSGGGSSSRGGTTASRGGTSSGGGTSSRGGSTVSGGGSSSRGGGSATSGRGGSGGSSDRGGTATRGDDGARGRGEGASGGVGIPMFDGEAHVRGGSDRTRARDGEGAEAGSDRARPRGDQPTQGKAVPRGDRPRPGDVDWVGSPIWIGGIGLGWFDPYYGGYPGYPGYPGHYYYEGDDYGEIRLKVKPRTAEVYVDGGYAGLVDEFDGFFQRLKVEPGTHRIEVVAEGFEPMVLEIKIMPRQTLTFEGDLQPAEK